MGQRFFFFFTKRVFAITHEMQTSSRISKYHIGHSLKIYCWSAVRDYSTAKIISLSASIKVLDHLSRVWFFRPLRSEPI